MERNNIYILAVSITTICVLVLYLNLNVLYNFNKEDGKYLIKWSLFYKEVGMIRLLRKRRQDEEGGDYGGGGDYEGGDDTGAGDTGDGGESTSGAGASTGAGSSSVVASAGSTSGAGSIASTSGAGTAVNSNSNSNTESVAVGSTSAVGTSGAGSSNVGTSGTGSSAVVNVSETVIASSPSNTEAPVTVAPVITTNASPSPTTASSEAPVVTTTIAASATPPPPAIITTAPTQLVETTTVPSEKQITSGPISTDAPKTLPPTTTAVVTVPPTTETIATTIILTAATPPSTLPPTLPPDTTFSIPIASIPAASSSNLPTEQPTSTSSQPITSVSISTDLSSPFMNTNNINNSTNPTTIRPTVPTLDSIYLMSIPGYVCSTQLFKRVDDCCATPHLINNSQILPCMPSSGRKKRQLIRQIANAIFPQRNNKNNNNKRKSQPKTKVKNPFSSPSWNQDIYGTNANVRQICLVDCIFRTAMWMNTEGIVVWEKLFTELYIPLNDLWRKYLLRAKNTCQPLLYHKDASMAITLQNSGRICYELPTKILRCIKRELAITCPAFISTDIDCLLAMNDLRLCDIFSI